MGNKKLFAAVIIAIFFLFANAGCQYNKEDLMPAACDNSIVTFSGSVKPIMVRYCVFCHSGPNAFNGVQLEEYTSVKLQIPNGKLLGTISHTPGFSPMPLGANKLSDCNIAKIRKWIAEGALNN